MLIQWALRILGYGATIVAPWVATKYGVEAGSCMGAAGGALLHKATTTILPKRK